MFGLFLSSAAIAQDPGKDFKAGEKSLKKFITDETKVGSIVRLLIDHHVSVQLPGQGVSLRHPHRRGQPQAVGLREAGQVRIPSIVQGQKYCRISNESLLTIRSFTELLRGGP